MLIGEIPHSIDAKGRYIVPAKFREDLGDRFIITKGFEHCLFVYTFEGWQRAAGNMRQLSTTDAEARKFARNFFSGAFEAEVDKQYRVVLPANLRAHAMLDKEIVTIGVSSRLEIWDKSRWEAYIEEADAEYEAAAVRFDHVNL